MAFRFWRVMLVLTVCVGMLACSSPTARLNKQAQNFGLHAGIIEAQGFRLRYYQNAANLPNTVASPLHVYLEGDGRPWQFGFPAVDPTPKHALALELMAADPMPALYLGRPCYHGFYAEGTCTSEAWTDARYSEPVVAAMAAALLKLLDVHPKPPVVLIGYSGGGALAVLLASRLSDVLGVITVAGNLDTERWTRLHDYTPLSASLNPMTIGFAEPTPHSHIVGAEDRNIPSVIAEDFVARYGGEVREIAGFDHRCCWREEWPAILKVGLESLLKQREQLKAISTGWSTD